LLHGHVSLADILLQYKYAFHAYISVRFEYEWRDADNQKQWMRIYGNEHWEFNDNGLMRIRDMSANDYTIQESERRYL